MQRVFNISESRFDVYALHADMTVVNVFSVCYSNHGYNIECCVVILDEYCMCADSCRCTPDNCVCSPTRVAISSMWTLIIQIKCNLSIQMYRANKSSLYFMWFIHIMNSNNLVVSCLRSTCICLYILHLEYTIPDNIHTCKIHAP